VIVAIGPEVTPGPLKETAELIDLGPTSMAALGIASGMPRDGKVLPSLVGDGVSLEVLEGNDATGGGDDDSGLTSDEEGEIEDHLRGLGYVE
jgi:hypothetical protein